MKSLNNFLRVCSVIGFLVPAMALAQNTLVKQTKYKIPVLIGKRVNPLIRIEIEIQEGEKRVLNGLGVDLKGSLKVSDIKSIRVVSVGADSSLQSSDKLKEKMVYATASRLANSHFRLDGNMTLKHPRNFLWLAVELEPFADLSGSLNMNVTSVSVNKRTLNVRRDDYSNRIGIAVRQHKQDNAHTYRIPGFATTDAGTLLAVYDVRWDTGRDLQGNIDIGLSRSTDKGKTWLPMQIIMDMGSWGGLPEKFNGVSDASILVDKTNGDIYVAGLWMHGVLDENGKWVEGLNEKSEEWNHQWKSKGSQPGFSAKETSQFLIIKSTDDGKSWSDPINLTKMCKKEEWWLWAPAPGQGITMKDGTIVFPTQGRDATGKPFSNITYSKDSGKTWATSNPATEESTTENMVVELNDGSLMLNMRSNANYQDTSSRNGRAVFITKNLGQEWTEHPTSHNGLPEPVCMASIIRHDFTRNGRKQSVLLFSNPNSKFSRNNMTIKVSYDNGDSWSKDTMILLDEWKGRGYSCLTSIDKETVGIIYESSQADLVFQLIKLEDLL